MARDLQINDVLDSLDKGRLAPFYLFYGPDEFRMERLVDRIREDYLPESARDLNLEICYGGEIDPVEIINKAQTLPFMSRNRLIIVRRVEEFNGAQLEKFLPYIENPLESTCLLFISIKTDFKKKFYKKMRSSGYAIKFAELRDDQIVPWIKRTANELGLKIHGQASAYLQQIVGNNLRDMYSELKKLKLRYADQEVGEDQVRELAIHSRIYSIFELMNVISLKDCSGALIVLNRFLEEEDKISGPLRFVGMLNRQLRILLQIKSIMDRGGSPKEAAGRLGLAPFSVNSFLRQVRHWSTDELVRGLCLLYQVDSILKSGSRPKPVLENLIIEICG